MPSPISVSCPNCSKTLKLRDKSKLGKKVRCPKCNKPFVLKLDQPDDDDFLSGLDEFDDYGTDYTDEELSGALPGSTAAVPSRKSKTESKKKKKSAKPDYSLIIGIGGGVLGLLLMVGLVGFLVMNLDSLLAGSSSEFAYLSDKTNFIMRIDFDELLKNPEINRQFEEAQNSAEMKKLLKDTDAKITDIDSVLFGFEFPLEMLSQGMLGGNPAAKPKMIIVAKFKRNVTLDDLLNSDSGFTSSEYNGKQVFVQSVQSEEMYMYLADDRTILSGSKSNIESIIDNGAKGSLPARAKIVDWSSGFAACFAPQNPRDVFGKIDMSNSPPSIPPSVTTLATEFKDKAEAIGFAMNVQDKADVKFAFKFSDSEAPAKVQTSLQEVIGLAKTQLAQFKSMFGGGGSSAEGASDPFKTAEDVLNNVEMMPGGDTLTLAFSAEIPVQDGSAPAAGPSSLASMSSMMGMFGALGNASNAAQGANERNNMRQIGLAMHNYHDTHRQFPDAGSKDKSGKPLLSWRVALLPYVDQNPLYKEFKQDEPWDSPHNIKLLDRMPDVYKHSATASQPNKTIYRVLQGPKAMFEGGTGRKMREITDGTSYTLMVVQANAANSVPWTAPDPFEVSLGGIGSKLHLISDSSAGFYLVLTGDGAVHRIPKSAGDDLLGKMITRNGKETVKLPDVIVKSAK